MIDVSVAAFGLTGVIMAAAIVAGLLAGGCFIWYRSRRAITIIEARGNQHNLVLRGLSRLLRGHGRLALQRLAIPHHRV